MTTRKITITIPEDAVARLKDFAEEVGMPLSTYIAQLVDHEIRIRQGLAAMREWDLEEGPLTEVELAEADAIIAEADAHAARVRAEALKKANDAA